MRFFSSSDHPQTVHHKRIRQGKKFLTALAFLLLSIQVSGQSSFTWYFGNFAGIKFNNNGTSVPMTGSSMNTTEGSTVTSDTAGVIMFYSDGVNVWNNSSSTPVFTSLLGSQSSTQAALAMAIPGTNCQRYLIFTTKGVEPGGNHDLGVALVNVTGTSPNYVITVSGPALSVLQPAGTVFFSEKLAATSDTAGGYWVVAHDYIGGAGTANTFYKYHITAAGFSTVTTTAQAQAALSSVQQTQSIGSNHQDLSSPYYNGQGQMKFSKAGQKLALVLAGSKTIDLFSFNLSTGMLTAVASTTVNPSNGNLYGCELSPLGNRLYASEGFAQSGTTVRKIYQYDISGGTLSSPYTVASGSNVYSNRYKYNALQLGPNDKIYCSEEMGISFLSVIQNPNISGSGCGWSSMTEPIAGTNALGLTTVMSNSGCICLPSPGAVTGPSVVCRGAVGQVYSVSAVPGATGYNWILPAGVIITAGNNTNTITVTFTGAAVSGTIRANAYNSYCTGVNSPPFSVTVTTPPVVTLGPDQTICQGQSVTFNAGACNGCTYQWANLTTGQPNIGTGQTYTTGVAGIYTVAVTGLGNCIGYDTVELFVQTAVPVSVNITASANPVCAGTQVTFSAIAQPLGGTITYTWKVNGNTVSGGTNSTYTYVPLNGDCVVCVFSTNSSCASGNPATSNQVCMTVNQNLPVSVTITASANPVCAGTSVTFTAFPVNPGGFPLFQWYVNSIPSGAGSSTFTYVPADGDCITCNLSSSNTCSTGNPATSNPICMTVNQNLPVSVTITASENPVCAGTSVTFTAFPVNPGGSPLVQWFVNGIPSGANSNTFAYTPVNGDCITCSLNSSGTCTTGNPATSNQVCMTVNQNLPVSVSIAASENPVCAGTSVTFTAFPVNPGGSPLVQWYVNNIPSGANSNTFAYIPVDGDCITCNLNSSSSCTTGNPATSNTVCMTVNPNLPVAVTINASANPVCAGTSVTFTAVPVNPGSSPLVQWYVNGSPAGGNSNSFTYVPVNGDCITCNLNSSGTCTIGNPATSNPICMTVNPNLPVSVTITASANPVCAGTSVTFTAFPVNPGGSPLVQWYVNSIPAGANSSTFTFTPANGNVVTCTLTSSETCTLANPVTSAPFAMTVHPLLPVSLTIAASSNPFCAGSTVTFTATPINGGPGPGYQWYVNGIASGPNQGSYSRVPAAGDVISCVMTSSETCATGNPATSPVIVMIEHPVPVVTFTPCFDTLTTISAGPYQLKGGLPAGGQFSGPGVNSSTGVFSPSDAGTGLKTITYSYTNVYSCMISKNKTILVTPASSFTCGNPLVDIRDNKVYATALIGTQCWMAENLDFGSRISDLTPQTDNCVAEKYTDHSSFVTRHSSFYQWDELMNYSAISGAQGLCPPGWHIPDLAEWEVLLNQYFGVGMAGGWLKDRWLANGFGSHQQGLFYQNNTWSYSSGIYAGSMYWTSVNISAFRAAARGINDYNPSVSRYDGLKSDAFNVRCVKN